MKPLLFYQFWPFFFSFFFYGYSFRLVILTFATDSFSGYSFLPFPDRIIRSLVPINFVLMLKLNKFSVDRLWWRLLMGCPWLMTDLKVLFIHNSLFFRKKCHKPDYSVNPVENLRGKLFPVSKLTIKTSNSLLKELKSESLPNASVRKLGF